MIEDSDALAAFAAVRGGDVRLDQERGRWIAHCHIAEHHESGMNAQLRRAAR